MNLRKYVSELPRGSAQIFAEKLSISAVYLSQLASDGNDRVASPSLCVKIERLTDYAVTRRELRPDWASIWPELINDEHPAPETSADQQEFASEQ